MLSYNDITKIFEEIELRLIASLKRNLSRHKQEENKYGFDWTAWQAEKLRNIDRFRQQNTQIMNSYTGLIDSQTRQIMRDEFAQGMNGVNVAVIENVGNAEIVKEPHFFGVDDTKINKLMDDITHLEKQAETAVLRMTDDVYRQTLHRVQLAMSTGSMTLQQAIDLSVQDFLNQGINCIVYKNGRRVNIADYVRMALRTTATRAKLQGESARTRSLGYDTVMVSHYSMCSPTCLPWQGKPYIDDVFSEWYGETMVTGDVVYGKSHYCGKWFPLLSSAIKGGLFHPNCRHTISMWRDGEPIPKQQDNSVNNRRYQLEQQQRALEREVRKAKRNVAGLSDPNNIKQAKKQLRQAQKNLREFIEQTNKNEGATILKRDYGREKIYDSSSVSQSVPSGSANNKSADVPLEMGNGFVNNSTYKENSQNIVDNYSENDIIESGQKYLESKPRLEKYDIDDCYNTANPNYQNGEEYKTNCQRSVMAYEARRRGYDVIAKPALNENDKLKKMKGLQGWSNVFQNGEINLQTPIGSTGSAIKQSIIQMMNEYGNGARAIVRVRWKIGGGGHVFIAEQVNGKTQFIDPQSGKRNVFYNFLPLMIIPEKTRLLRIDDKEFTGLISMCVE